MISSAADAGGPGPRRDARRALSRRVRLPLPASDPGLLRLTAALRTVLSVGLTLAVLALLGVPLRIQVTGAMAALISTFAVSETRLRDQAVTLALGLPVAGATVAAGTALAPHRIAADTVFVLVIFGAVYVRRFGLRGKALGMIAFQMFFIAQFVQVETARLAQVGLALLVAFGCGALVRFGLLRVTPEQTLDLLMGSFRTRLRQAVGAMAAMAALAEAAERAGPAGESNGPAVAGGSAVSGKPAAPAAPAGGGPDGTGRERAERRLRQRIVRLHEGALMIQDRLEDSTPDASTAEAVQRRIAGMEVTAERLAAVLLDGERPPHTPLVTVRLRELYEAVGRDWLQKRTPVGLAHVRDRLLGYRENENLTGLPAGDQEALRAMGELAFSVLGLRVALGAADGDDENDSPRTRQYREELETEELSRRAESGLRAERGPRADSSLRAESSLRGRPDAEKTPADEGTAEPGGLRRPSTRTAFQVTVGSAMAIVGGELLSPQRWYWAVLTCWVVFLGTASTGEILVKGYRRLAGTAVGVVAGAGLTGLVAGHTGVSFALILFCVFAAFYFAPVSHTLTSFFMTAMLGLLFTLLNTYSRDIFVLRVEETAIGVVCGLTAALLVLPIRTAEHTDELLRTVLERLSDVTQEAVRRLSGERPGVSGGAPPGARGDTVAPAVPAAGEGSGAPAPASVPPLPSLPSTPSAHPVDLLEAARELDDALDGLRSAVQPLTHPVSPLRSRSQTARYVVALLDSAAYHARGLAAVAEQLTGDSRITPDPRVAAAAGRLTRNLRTLTRSLEEPEEQRDEALLPGSDTLTIAVIDHPSRSPVGSRVARHIHRLDEIVIGLAEPLGVRVEGARGAGDAGGARGGAGATGETAAG
ncbi:FUSC family protein [Streptomyces xinghaiensis]|uniref:FUSC family protein n=1 Tax=Streptomyces xinghaiensis TaxID=1038928 RepID=UPI002E13D29F|nr:FUSC family protein [Streptomyces xinghaiensis]